ncbi:MAG: hypothetical protein EU533_04875, partial [Promethearchaeota archaeon]
MDFKELDKDTKTFLLIGAPIVVFLTLFLIISYVQISMFFLLILGIAAGGLLKRKRIKLRATKVAILVLVIYLFMFYNLLHLPSQIERRLPQGRNHLLEPNNPKIKEFRDEFYKWHLDKYNASFADLKEDSRADLELKLLRLDYYVRRVRMEYTYDTNPPYFYYDHLPTIDEIFESDSNNNGKLEDDCDGITILTASVLLRMGYNAWVAEVDYHYHTMVFDDDDDPHKTKGYNNAILLYNSKSKPAYIIFNEEETIFPPTRPLYISIFEIFTGRTMWESYFLGFFHGKYFNIPFLLMIPLSYTILVLLSYVMIKFVALSESVEDLDKKRKRRTNRNTSLKLSLVLSLGAFLLYIISAT